MSSNVQNMFIQIPNTEKVSKLLPQNDDQIRSKEFKHKSEKDKNMIATNFLKILNDDDVMNKDESYKNKLAAMYKNYRKAKNCMAHKKLCKFMVVTHA